MAEDGAHTKSRLGRRGWALQPILPPPLPFPGAGYGWVLSDEARRDIEDIERCIIARPRPW